MGVMVDASRCQRFNDFTVACAIVWSLKSIPDFV